MGDSKPYSLTPEGRRAYYEENRERILAKKRERYANDPKHRERNKARRQKQRAENGDAIREQERQRAARSRVMVRKGEIGCCQRCGYDRCLAALDWHHVDPATKRFRDLRGRPDHVVDEELAKCVLVCANCHRELHAGLWSADDLLERVSDR